MTTRKHTIFKPMKIEQNVITFCIQTGKQMAFFKLEILECSVIPRNFTEEQIIFN